MKSVNRVWVPLLGSALRACIENFASDNQDGFLSDLYISYSDEEGVLRVYDDLENELQSLPLENEADASPEVFQKELIQTLRSVLRTLEKERFFDRDFIFKPFTVSFVDSSFSVTEELIYVDDDTLKLDSDLLADLDKDLDNFLRDLMK